MNVDPITAIAFFYVAFLAFCAIGAAYEKYADWRDWDHIRRADRLVERTIDRIIADYGYDELRDHCPDTLPQHWTEAA